MTKSKTVSTNVAPKRAHGTRKAQVALTPVTERTDDSSALAYPSPAKPISKQQQFAALLVRDEGATLDQMVEATGWLPHTTRAALTGLKKKGYAISSDKVGDVRTYRAVAPE